MNKIIKVNKLEIGGERPVIIAGPCSIESQAHILAEAEALKALGVDMLRGGAFKPRTSPQDFQGLGMEGIRYFRQAADQVGLPMVTEVLSEYHIDQMIDLVDVFQVGSRNMYNYELLKQLGQTNKPVLLKRGFSATLREWQMAGEYVIQAGNDQVIYCERGIRSYDVATRNTLDLAGAVLMKEMTGCPVIFDPSHGTGVKSLICPMTKAGLAAGLDGAIIEVHRTPDKAWTDGFQSLNHAQFGSLMQEITR